MDESMLKELEAAALIVMDPLLGSPEQRQASEALFLNFRKTKTPYSICQQILERSTVDLVLFEAAGVLKQALIFEWDFLQDSDKVSLRQYLLNYVMNRELQSFVRERILQVIAIMIKRSSIADLGVERNLILEELKQIIMAGDIKQQYLACRVLSTMMQEYVITIKSDDTGLTFEDHFKAKKHFESTGLMKIFIMILEALEKMLDLFEYNNQMHTHLCLEFLMIMETILSWGYTSPLLPKRLIGLFEMVYKIDQAPSLRLNMQWENTILDPKVLKLFFSIYWKVRDIGELQIKAATCLVQLSTLNGPILNKKENRLRNAINYFTHFLQLISSINIMKQEEVLPFSTVVRKLLFYNQPNSLKDVPQNVINLLLQKMFQMTCKIAEGKVQEEVNCTEDTVYTEALTNMLESWLLVLQGKDVAYSTEVLIPFLMEIFNKYLQCHLSPPDGVRGVRKIENEEIDENEQKDRDKYKEQLIIIGAFGREFPSHSLPILAKLLEEKIRRLHAQLQRMYTTLPNGDNMSFSTILETLFEDIHWILLITGHVLCIESEGEQPIIPSEIMLFSIQQANSGAVDITTSLKLLASPTQCISEFPNAENTSDHIIRLISAMFRLCEIEKVSIEAKMINFLSPEVSCDIMWLLKYWSEAYLLPLPEFYHDISGTIKAAFGVDTPGGNWSVNFLLNKIYINVKNFTAEEAVINDSIKLLVSLLKKKHKCAVAFNADCFKSIVELKNLSLPLDIKCGLLKGLVIAATCITDTNIQKSYLNEILQPICNNYKSLASGESEKRPMFVQQVINNLNEIKACMDGAASQTAHYLFESFEPILVALANLLDYLHNSNQIVEAVLELLCEVVQNTLYLDQASSQKVYEVCMNVIRIYVKHNSNRMTSDKTGEDESLQDLLLLLKLMNHLLSKNFYDIGGDNANSIDTAEVCIFGLTYLMPLITPDLLKYPALCLQYYQTITFFLETKSHKVCVLNVDLLSKILGSVEMGLTSFGAEIQSLCFDFLQILANTVYFDQNSESFMYSALGPFLKLILEMILTQQVGSENKNECSKALFSLICCYKEQFVQLVQHIIQSQTNPVHAERLSKEFTELTNNIDLVNNRVMQFKFIEKFDKFIVNIGFMYSI